MIAYPAGDADYPIICPSLRDNQQPSQNQANHKVAQIWHKSHKESG